jgi:hypothetical protein
MGNRERLSHILICKFCEQSYTSKRSDSNYCSPAHRTAAYRVRKNRNENYLRLNVNDRRFGLKISAIKRELGSLLKSTLEFDQIGILPFSVVKTAHEKLNNTIQIWINYNTNSIREQIVWIWENVLPFYLELERKNKKTETELCHFRLTGELRNEIEKMIERKRSY